MIDKMHAELSATIENADYSPALWVALSLGMNLLDKYYSLLDDSEIYRIATGMYNMNLSWSIAIYKTQLYLLSPSSKT